VSDSSTAERDLRGGVTRRASGGTLCRMMGEPENGAPPPAVQDVTSLTYVGHATVLIEMDGVRVLTDPLLRRNLGPLLRHGAMPDIDAIRTVDAILISHGHIDHLDVGSLRRLDRSARLLVPAGSAKTVKRLGFASVEELEIGDVVAVGAVTLRATPADHPTKRYPYQKIGVSMGLVVDGTHSIYFAGDTGLFSDMDEIGERLDLALLPISGWGLTLPDDHLNPLTAAQALKLLRPRTAVPIHWGTYFAPGLPQVWRGRDTQPPRAFARYAAHLAPEVAVDIVSVGGTWQLDRDGDASDRTDRVGEASGRTDRVGEASDRTDRGGDRGGV
jgi:L-ascorbate metabolism protein UlaG (beta-lactamase superfamily)